MAAFLALLVFAPLMLVLAFVVPLESDGPAIFQQERMGRNGEVFTLYKFRSMVQAASHGSPITVTGDNRVTRIGALLRRFKLDELPQFLNVLKGDMSLVGPRPKLPHHEALLMPFRPGVTGAATLAFRFEEELLERVPKEHLDDFYDRCVKPHKAKIDWEYMQTANAGTDIDILWKTAKACFSKTAVDHTSYEDLLPYLAEVERKHPASVTLAASAGSDSARSHTSSGFSLLPEQAIES